MEQTRASLTALGAALMRAAHTRLDPSPLINDPWGDRIVLEAEREAVLSVVLQSLSAQDRERCEKLGDRNAVLDAALQLHPGYGWAILRARYAEDALETAVGRGVHQYVIVGAGFDSFALRQPPFARHVLVFEVDHPATQGVKRERLHGCDVPLPHTLHLVPADLSHEQLADALARSAFRPTEPTFFAWLGVTQYLTREANLATLRGIAGCSAQEASSSFRIWSKANWLVIAHRAAVDVCKRLLRRRGSRGCPDSIHPGSAKISLQLASLSSKISMAWTRKPATVLNGTYPR
jgi:methyltransferase (TIGR00027 family)